MASSPSLPAAFSCFGGGGRGIVPPREIGRSMELRCEACHLFFSHGRQRRRAVFRPPSRFEPEKRFLAPHSLQRIKLKIDPKVPHRQGVSSYLCTSTSMSQKNGDSVITCRGLYKVLWSIEADVADGYLIFITGDPVTLGCWEPRMASILSPCKRQANLWIAEIKVPCGIHFKYNYFTRKENIASGDLVWRPGPEFSLSVPVLGTEGVIMVRDFWMSYRIQEQPVPSWGSWMMDLDLPDDYLNGRDNPNFSTGELNILRNFNGLPLSDKSLSVSSIPVKNVRPDYKNVEINAYKSGENLSEREQPIEEPWLLRSTLLSLSGASELDEAFSQDEKSRRKSSRELHKAEKAASEDEDKVTCPEEPASTVILINSSVCTMQRIAVLEEDKLVELLLEPVKNTVQCDSIYLGVVTKLVPHMGGAFVDIGISRPSLMDIKRYRKPFVFPPLHNEVEGDMNNEFFSLWPKDYSDNHEHDRSYYDDEDVTDDLLEVDNQNDLLQTKYGGTDEHEAEDDFDVSDATNINPSIETSESDGMETDFGVNGKGIGIQIEDDDIEDFLPLETENKSDLPILIQESLRDSSNSRNSKSKWAHVREGTKILVQVVKEGLGTKGPALTAYPNLRSRFWILITRCNRIGVSKKITGVERSRLKVIAKTLQPSGFGLTVRTVAAGHSIDELKNDLEGLLSTWKGIVEHAKSAALAAEEGVEGAVPLMLHRAMGQTLSVVQDYFNEKVKSMVVDSPRTYHEVTSYLQEIAPNLCNRVALYEKRTPIFDEYNIEEEISNILSKRVALSNGGYLVIEQTEALVSIDVNGGHCMLGEGTSQEKAVLDVNLAAAKQIAREIRLRDIGGIIVVDFIDMADESNRRLVYEEMKKAVERDRSTVRVSELSRLGLMEITRKRVRPSVTFMISEPCSCCHATGRVEALETSFSKIEHEICRLLAVSDQKPDPENAKTWPRFVLRVDRYMCNYLTSGKRTKLAILSSSLKVWILLKVARGFSRGSFEVKPFVDGKANDELQQLAISRLRPTKATTYIPSTKQLQLFPVKKIKGRAK